MSALSRPNSFTRISCGHVLGEKGLAGCLDNPLMATRKEPSLFHPSPFREKDWARKKWPQRNSWFLAPLGSLECEESPCHSRTHSRSSLEPLMNSPDNIAVIRQYLEEQFPKHFIADFLEAAGRAQVFRVDGPTGHPLHYAVLGLDFLLDHTADGLQQVLVSSGLGGKLRVAGASPVTFSKTGFRIEGRKVSAGLINDTT